MGLIGCFICFACRFDFAARIPARIGAFVPCVGAKFVDGAERLNTKFGGGFAAGAFVGTRPSPLWLIHGRKPSKIIWSAQRVARCRSAGVRTAQVNNGM